MNPPKFAAHMPVCTPLHPGPNIAWRLIGDLLEDEFQDLNNPEVSAYLLAEDPLSAINVLSSTSSSAGTALKFHPYHVTLSFNSECPVGIGEVWGKNIRETNTHIFGLRVSRFDGIGNVYKHSVYSLNSSRTAFNKKTQRGVHVSYTGEQAIVCSIVPVLNGATYIVFRFDKTAFISALTGIVDAGALAKAMNHIIVTVIHTREVATLIRAALIPFSSGLSRISQMFNNKFFNASAGSFELFPHLPESSAKRLRNWALLVPLRQGKFMSAKGSWKLCWNCNEFLGFKYKRRKALSEEK